ncbi:MAG: MAPEG family protein [Robiginitomaculum sp.]|nr:MAPEG family protein [Robiginitomaculum sp.]
MTALSVTGIYAAFLGIILIILRIRVTIIRAKTGISIYHGDDMALAEKIRQHANFTENIPHALILMACVELVGASFVLLNIIGCLLLASRILNPFGIKHDIANHPLRIVSGIMTVAPMVISIIFILKSTMLALS